MRFFSKAVGILLVILLPISTAFVIVSVLDRFYSKSITILPPAADGLRKTTWTKVHIQKEIENLLNGILRSKSTPVRSSWKGVDKSFISRIIYKHGYERLGIDHYTVMAIIDHESGFNLNQVAKNKDEDGNITSYDYYLTQQNSLQVRKRYYSLRSYLRNKETDTEIRDVLLKKMHGDFSLSSVKDPAVGVALMFQTFRECKQILGMASVSTPRMILCYNLPAYAKRIMRNKIGKTEYVKAIMQKRKRLLEII